MTVYILFFLFLFLFGLSTNTTLTNKQVLVTSVVFWLFIGFRNISVGTDTLGYVMDYKEYSGMAYSQLIEALSEKNEPLYYLILWLLSPFREGYTIMLLAWAAFPATALYFTQKRELTYSSDITISYLVLFLLGFFVFFTAGIRQTVAISIVLLSYKYLKEPLNGKLWKDKNTLMFFLLLFIGYLVHNSILIFAITYPIKMILQSFKLKGWFILPILALYPLGKSINLGQIQFFANYFFEDRFHQYGETYESSWTASAFIMQMIIFLICFSVRKKLELQDKCNTLLLNIVLVGLVFQSMAGVIAEMARVSYYFSIFYVILLPRALRALSDRGNKSIINWGFVVVSMVYLFFLTSTNLPKYSFFWK